MRRGYKPSLYKNDAGEIYAINLGSDFCSEHEHGVERIYNLMGCKTDAIGIDRYKSKNSSLKNVLSFRVNYVFYILFGGYWGWNNLTTTELKEEFKKRYRKGSRELSLYGDELFGGAWSDNDFGIAVSINENEAYPFALKLSKAIEDGDFSVWFSGEGGNNPFVRPGLVIGITSMVPKEIQDYMAECHIEEKRINDADEATGIKILLKEKGKKYFACKVDWLKERFTVANGEKKISKYPVIYFLNPWDQEDNNCGWFTVEELTDWANDVSGNKITKVKQKKSVTA